jgi:hypothetical protein
VLESGKALTFQLAVEIGDLPANGALVQSWMMVGETGVAGGGERRLIYLKCKTLNVYICKVFG